jgi:hypothetical protein
MRVVWTLGLLAGLVAGAVALTETPLFVKLLVGLAVVLVGVAGPIGSAVLAGLLLGAGLLTFVVLLLTADSAAVSASVGVATLLIASGVAFSFRELFRDRTSSAVTASAVSRQALAERTSRQRGASIAQRDRESSEGVRNSLDDLAERVTKDHKESE